MERKVSVTPKQKEILIEFLKSHPQLLSGNFAEVTKKEAQALWQELALTLNSVPGGASKDWMHWRKTWQDLKKNTKGKSCLQKKYASGTGGGPASSDKFSDFENEVLALISPTVIHGDLKSSESSTLFEFDVNLPSTTVNNELEEQVLELLNPVTGVKENIIIKTKEKIKIEPEVNKNIEPHSLPGTSTKPKKIKTNKVTRLQTSLGISKDLLDATVKKNVLDKNYYDEKIKILKLREERRKKYEENKIKVLQNTLSVQEQILRILTEKANTE